MPLIETSPYSAPYLVYDAPENEKTKELRKKFDIDPQTGYPRKYNWKELAKLGPEYQPYEPFYKFRPCNDDEMLSTRVTHIGMSVILSTATRWAIAYRYSQTFWARPMQFFGVMAAYLGGSYYFTNWNMKRQALKNAMFADYMERHPERFGTVKRYKLRECLYEWFPIR